MTLFMEKMHIAMRDTLIVIETKRHTNEIERLDKQKELRRLDDIQRDKDRIIMQQAIDNSRREEDIKREVERLQMQKAMEDMITKFADTQSANTTTTATAFHAPTTTSSLHIGPSSVAASTVQIFDVNRTSPGSHCFIMHDNNTVYALLKHVHWDDGKPTYEVEPFNYYKVFTSIEVEEDNIWPYSDKLNNKNKDNHVTHFKSDILASHYTPLMTVKYTKGMDETIARISRVTLLDPTDPELR